MKFLCKIVLAIFIIFLATPTILSVIDKDIDISYFFNTSEEENNSDFSEINSITSINSFSIIIDFEAYQRAKFLVLKNRKVNSVALNIFIHPPELI